MLRAHWGRNNPTCGQGQRGDATVDGEGGGHAGRTSRWRTFQDDSMDDVMVPRVEDTAAVVEGNARGGRSCRCHPDARQTTRLVPRDSPGAPHNPRCPDVALDSLAAADSHRRRNTSVGLACCWSSPAGAAAGRPAPTTRATASGVSLTCRARLLVTCPY